MVIFGGFEHGIRQNSILMFDFDTSQWENLEAQGPSPQARAGHSATIYKNKMYVFGGKDEDNEKLKDFWCFNFESGTWEQL
jgi:N-acetylneuraminic acid mutarotase